MSIQAFVQKNRFLLGALAALGTLASLLFTAAGVEKHGKK